MTAIRQLVSFEVFLTWWDGIVDAHVQNERVRLFLERWIFVILGMLIIHGVVNAVLIHLRTYIPVDYLAQYDSLLIVVSAGLVRLGIDLRRLFDTNGDGNLTLDDLTPRQEELVAKKVTRAVKKAEGVNRNLK